MSESKDKNTIRNDEIDLLDLFRKLGRTINKVILALWSALLTSIVFLFRRWVWLLLSIFAGIGISYIVKSTAASFYTSDLVLRNNLVQLDKKTKRDNSGTTAGLISRLNKLHTFCEERNYEELVRATSLNPEVASKLSDISAYWIIDLNRDGSPDYVDYKGNHNVYDTINVRLQTSFDVRIKINSPIELDQVREGIIRFIENDSLYQQRNRLRLKQNDELLTRLTFDIKELDSLQKVKYFEETRNMRPANGGQIIFMQEQKTQLVYSDIYMLYDKKQILETERDLYKNIITVLSDFPLPARRENGLMFYGKIVIPIVFAVVLAILIIFANRKKLLEIYNKY